MLTREEIRLGYRFVLGREPESEDAYAAHEKHPDLPSFRRVLLTSGEGQDRLRRDLRDNSRQFDFIGDCERPQLVMIHLEKTGGTALYDAIARAVPEGRSSVPHMAHLPETSLAEFNAYDFISGHFCWSEAAAMPRRAKRIVALFREPVDRLISFYRFQRAHPREATYDNPLVALAHELRPAEYFSHPEVRASPRVDNAYLRAFAPFHSLTERTPATMRLLVALAEARIASLDAIGLTNAMDRSARVIASINGLRLPITIDRVHTTDGMGENGSGFTPVDPVRRYPALVEALAGLVDYDRMLYRAAKARYATLAAIHDPDGGWSG